MRRREGKSLLADLLKHTKLIATQLAEIQGRAPSVIEDYHRKLTQRVNLLLSKAELQVNQDDLLKEVAVFAERADISEEIQRLTSHLEAFEHACRTGEHAGRKLDFITQEMLREANTIASKANDRADRQAHRRDQGRDRPAQGTGAERRVNPPDAHGQSTKHSGLLIILCGPSGVGKSTISRQLAERHSVTYIVSATTRPHATATKRARNTNTSPRTSFSAGSTPTNSWNMPRCTAIITEPPSIPPWICWPRARIFCWKSTCRGRCRSVISIRNALPIFILPPDEPTLLHRLEARGRDSAEEIAKRFRAAKREIHMAKGSRAFDYMVINDDLNRAVEEIIKIIKHKRSGGI